MLTRQDLLLHHERLLDPLRLPKLGKFDTQHFLERFTANE
jgi:hypothetical protein